MRSSWNWVGPESNDKKKRKEEERRENRHRTQEEGHVDTEADFGGMCL